MSINHYSSSDIPEPTTLWWNTQQHHEPSPSWASHICQVSHSSPTQRPRGFNLNHDDEEDDEDNMIPQPTPQGDKGEATADEEKEAMFEKPLTPSDVGKLNRLVIPKQHAEKYLPLGESGGESKGVSLSFEDECGKCWRFRYSYWNSSQSYVLTKGWSRYVKDKRLDAGDVVFFLRHRTHPHRLFIHCGRRRHHSPTTPIPNVALKAWTTTPLSSLYSAHPYPTHPPHPFPYHQPPYSRHAGGGSDGDEGKTTSAVGNSSSSSSRVLRLFGVNMECQPDESGSSTPECSYVSPSQGTPTQHQHQHHHCYGHYYRQAPYSSNHMDANQMRNRRG